MGNGMRLLLMALVGLLLILIGATGRLGSILGAIFTPDYMLQGQESFPWGQ